MKTTLLAVLSLLLVLGTTLTAQDTRFPVDQARNPAEAALLGSAPFRADHVIVRFTGGVDLASARALVDPARFLVEEPLMPSLDMYLLRIVDGTRVPDAIQSLLSSLAVVRYAVPDHVVTARATTPNDPSFAGQWCHTKMQTAMAWDFGQGSRDFVVSVVDGGCMISHADLAASLYTNAAEAGGVAGVDDDGNGYVDDLHGWNAFNNNGTIPNDGHGTHVNGIVGAVGNNGLGVAGVNWNVTLMPVAGASGTTSTVVKAYNYVLAQKQKWLATGGAAGANAVSTNSSFGVDYGNCASPAYAPWNDAYNAMGAVGILSCAATANLNINIDVTGDVPTGCASPYMVAVTNTTSTDVKNSGAAYGLTTIDLGAPGTGINSTYSSGGYTSMTGTSMASPQVAGAIGFLHSVGSASFAAFRAADPAAAALVLKQVILDNVDVIASLQFTTVSGGRLNVFKAATAMNAWAPTGSGTIVAYGEAVGGANIGRLAGGASPDIGASLVLDISLFDPSTAVAALALSLGQASLPYKGGTLLIDPTTMFFSLIVPLSGGAGSVSLPIPNNPGLVGFVTDAQCGGPDVRQPAGIALSNGVAITIGQ